MSTRRRLAVSLVAAAAAAGAVPLFVGSGPAGAAPAPAGCPSTPSYGYTIPTPVGPPTAVSLTGDDFAETGYAALGGDSKLYYAEGIIDPDPSDTQLDVSPLACLGGQGTDAPGLTVSADGTRAFFVRASNNSIYQRYANSPAGYTSIGNYTAVNGATSTNGPAAVQTANGTYHLFIRDASGALRHGYRTTTSLTSWRWETIGGNIVGSPVAVVDGSSILVAAVGTNNAVYTVRGSTYGSSAYTWGPITKMVNRVNGTVSTQLTTQVPPALVADPETGAISVYAVSKTYGLFVLSKAANAGFTGALWYRVDSVLPPNARIAAATNGADSIVYARFTDTSTGRVLTAFTQYTDATDSWSDYFLAPYTCYDCAPFGLDAGSAGKVSAKSAAAKLSPGQGKMAKATTKMVLKHKN